MTDEDRCKVVQNKDVQFQLPKLIQPVVTTAEGKLRGQEIKSNASKKPYTYYSFVGIPYAKPPIGDLRFCPPEPPDPWTYTKNAIKESKICIQYDVKSEELKGEEDCLYLNVFTPKLPGCCLEKCQGTCTDPYPVMLFIHGGGFLFGNGVLLEKLGPDYFVKNNIVLVSINYRLNVFGFLSLNRKEAPGNMGLKDQVMALQWVKRNIINFNGDPNNVTIFGLSAGAACVNYHLISPMSQGLFHKAIAQSGSAIQHWAFNKDVKSLAFKIPQINEREIFDENELYNYLKHLPSKELVKAAALAVQSNKYKGGSYYGFVPTLEVRGDWTPFLPKLPYELLEHGKFNPVPYIAGYTTRESLTIIEPGEKIIGSMLADKNLVKRIPFHLKETDINELRGQLGDIYLKKKENKVDNVGPCVYDDDFAINFISDVDFIGGIIVSTSLIARNNIMPVYLYEFSYEGALNLTRKKLGTKRPGACHGDEMGYLFKQDNKGLKESVYCSDKLLRERMTQMWTNFAKYGNPTPMLDAIITTKWLPVTDPESLQYLNIGEDFKMCQNPYPERMEIFYELYSRYRETNSLYFKED